MNGSTSFLKVNGASASAPFGVTVSAGSSFTLEYRVSGLPSGNPNPLIGGFIRPLGGTASWVASNGPTWTDNSKSAITPWGANKNDVVFGTGYGVDGTTFDNGIASDLNGLASNEVFSATLSPPSAPGNYTLFAGAAHENDAGVPEYSEASFYVIVAAPTPSPTFTATPTQSPALSPTITQTPNLSETPTFTATISPTFTVSATVTLTFTLTPLPGFPGFKASAIFPNPVISGASLYLETYSASDSIELRIYDASFKLAHTVDFGGFNGGRALLPFKIPPGLGNGAYFAQVISRRQGRFAKSAQMPFVVLR